MCLFTPPAFAVYSFAAYQQRNGSGWVDMGALFCTKVFNRPKTVSHPCTNQAWHGVTTLIETNTLQLSRTGNCCMMKCGQKKTYLVNFGMTWLSCAVLSSGLYLYIWYVSSLSVPWCKTDSTYSYNTNRPTICLVKYTKAATRIFLHFGNRQMDGWTNRWTSSMRKALWLNNVNLGGSIQFSISH